MKRITLSIIALAITLTTFGQAPEGFKYQAVVRDVSSNILTNQAVGMQLTILQGALPGTAVYTETFAPTTNGYGLVNLEIGTGITVDNFSTIDWANGPYFIETAVDVTGGTSYSVMGTSQLMSVPYALHAKTAENVINGFSGDYNDLTNQPIIPTVPTNVSTFTNDAGYLNSFTEVDGSTTNELQALSISNDTVYLTNGGFVKLPTGFDGQYSSLTGVPTNVSTFTNDAGYLTTEVDGSMTNELQTISRTGTTVTLSNGGGAFQDSVGVYTAGEGINITNNVVSSYLPKYGATSSFVGGWSLASFWDIIPMDIVNIIDATNYIQGFAGFTVLANGEYLITYNLNILNNCCGTDVNSRLTVNGIDVLQSHSYANISSGSTGSLSNTTILSLSAGDVVEIQAMTPALMEIADGCAITVVKL